MNMKVKGLSFLLILSNILITFNAYADTSKIEHVDLPVSEVVDYIYEFDVGEFVKDDAVVSGGIDIDSERIGFLNSLGLWDDTEKSKSAFLTLKEFNTIMSEISTSYQEISGGENVTYGVVIESLLKELGYYSKCSIYSDKEKAIIDEATEIGLIKNDAKISSSFVTRAEFAKLVERAITIDICVMTYENGTYKWIVKDGETVLSTMHDIKDISGFVNAIPGLSVYGDSDIPKGQMEINRLAISTGDVDCAKYIGKFVKAYAKYDKTRDEYNLIYIGPHEKGKSMEFDFQNVEEINDDYISYTDSEGNLKKVKIQSYKSITENGKLLSSVSQMSDFEENDGKIVLSASTKNGDYDVAMIYTYNYYVVKYNDLFQNRIGLEFGQKFKEQDFIQIDEEGINHVVIDGVISDYTKISAGSTIRVFRNDDTGYTDISAVTIKQSGHIGSIYDDYVVVGDKTYRMSADLIKTIAETEGNTNLAYEKRIKKPKVNEQVMLYLFGDVLAGYKSADEYIYAYLKSVKLMETEADEIMILRVYTENMEWHDLTLAKNITLDGVKRVSNESATETLRLNKKRIVSNLVRIKTNAKDEITALDTMIETEEEKETTDDLVYVPDYENGTAVFKHSWDNWSLKNTKYMFADGALVFVIPENEEREDKYKIIGSTAFTQDKEYKVTLYSPDKFNAIPAMIYRGDISSGANEKERWLYITKINQILNEETDELLCEVVGLCVGPTGAIGGRYFQEEKLTLPFEDYETAVKAGNGFSVGDLIYLEYTGKKLATWELETELEKGKIAVAPGIYDHSWIMGNNAKVVVGTVEALKLDGKKLISINTGSDIRTYVTSFVGIIDLQTKELSSVDLSDIHEGDTVYAITIGNYSSVTIKNVQK